MEGNFLWHVAHLQPVAISVPTHLWSYVWTDTVTCCLGWQQLRGAAPSCWRLPASYSQLRKVGMLHLIHKCRRWLASVVTSSHLTTFSCRVTSQVMAEAGVQSRVNPRETCDRHWHRQMFAAQQFGITFVNTNRTVHLPYVAWAMEPSQVTVPQFKPITRETECVQWSTFGGYAATSAL